MNCFIFVTHYLNIFRIHEKHSNTFSIACRLNLNYNNKELLPKRVFREKTKGQPVAKKQIVYKTKSDLRVFVMPQRYIIFWEPVLMLSIKSVSTQVVKQKRRHPSQDTFFTGRQHPSLPKLPKRFFINRFYITTRRPGSLFY